MRIAASGAVPATGLMQPVARVHTSRAGGWRQWMISVARIPGAAVQAPGGKVARIGPPSSRPRRKGPWTSATRSRTPVRGSARGTGGRPRIAARRRREVVPQEIHDHVVHGPGLGRRVQGGGTGTLRCGALCGRGEHLVAHAAQERLRGELPAALPGRVGGGGRAPTRSSGRDPPQRTGLGVCSLTEPDRVGPGQSGRRRSPVLTPGNWSGRSGGGVEADAPEGARGGGP